METGSLEIAEALCNKRKPNEAVPYLMKAMEDPNNMDAFVQCAFLCPTLDESVECLEAGIVKGTSSYHITPQHQIFNRGTQDARP